MRAFALALTFVRQMFEKILIANRGEIALRVIRACKELGIRTLAVYSEADVDSLHVQLADESICIGSAAQLRQLPEDRSHHERGRSRRRRCDSSRLRIPRRERALRRSLRELQNQVHRPDARRRCARWATRIPPGPAARKAGVPVTPGSDGIVETEAEAIKVAKKIGYPVMIKAVSGGGGRGMRAAHNEVSLVQGFHGARLEAEKAFGNAEVYIEKLLVNPHHIEFQIVADTHGNTVHLGERDCSIQRRNQKVIEECPSPLLTPAMRRRMGQAAVKLAQSVGYVNAGTMEFLVDQKGALLLHRDEHPHPGGAHHHGGSLRLRSGQRTDSHRGGRQTFAARRPAAGPFPRHPVPDQRGRPGAQFPALARPDQFLLRARRARECGSIPTPTPATPFRLTMTR